MSKEIETFIDTLKKCKTREEINEAYVKSMDEVLNSNWKDEDKLKELRLMNQILNLLK